MVPLFPPRIGLAALAILVVCCPRFVAAQVPAGLPPEVLPLDRLDAFANPGPNWQIVGGISADPDVRHDLQTSPGSGILVNLPTETARTNLYSAWSHGDIDLDLEVSLPRESNSGIYLQGRYEVQLLDSRRQGPPRFGDIGGIYERWDESAPAGQNGYEGTPPRVNAARAPGLWQQMNIAFRAPRFDGEGRKVANARFVRVVLNGVVIQENVEVTGPTRGAISADEVLAGPLVIQGDHGPVAFRNISFKRYERTAPQLQDIHYRAFLGEIHSIRDIEAAEPSGEGPSSALTLDLAPARDNYALVFDAALDVRTPGAHHFSLLCQGGCRLEVGADVLGPEDSGRGWVREGRTIQLAEGRHPVRVTYFKSNPWWRPTLAVHVEGPEFERAPLHADDPPRRPRTIDPIYVDPDAQPSILRSFMEHEGVKRTHVISVGSPHGIHYSYDLESGSLLQVWRGDFLDVTQMWHERGEPQLAVPRGTLVTFPLRPTLIAGSAVENPVRAGATADLIFQGYVLDSSGYPSFHFGNGELRVEDHLTVSPEGGEVRRSVSVSASGQEPLWVRLATAVDVTPTGDGTYVLDGRRYYLTVEAPADAVRIVDGADGKKDLLAYVPPQGGVVNFAVRF